MRNPTGDIMMLRRNDNTQHCVIFLNWLVDKSAKTKIVGLVYFSSQKLSTGCTGVGKEICNLPGNDVSLTKPTPDTPSNKGGYGFRSELFEIATFEYTGLDGNKVDLLGQIVASESYCFHFTNHLP